MRYKRVKRIPFRGNSERCLVLRQQYAKFMLGLLSSGRRVINIDETWINQTDFRRMKWRQRGETNSLPCRQVNPRVSLLTAIDTSGRVYFAATQVNTNSDIFLLFMSKLQA